MRNISIPPLLGLIGRRVLRVCSIRLLANVRSPPPKLSLFWMLLLWLLLRMFLFSHSKESPENKVVPVAQDTLKASWIMQKRQKQK